jgi:hypothetical protein
MMVVMAAVETTQHLSLRRLAVTAPASMLLTLVRSVSLSHLMPQRVRGDKDKIHTQYHYQRKLQLQQDKDMGQGT